MPRGNVAFKISDLRSQALSRPVTIELRRDPGVWGAGGENVNFEFTSEGVHTEARLKGIATQGGSGTRYTFRFRCSGYKTVSFFQFVAEGDQQGIQPVYLPVDPKRVKDIMAPDYPALPQALRSWLSSAEMTAVKPGDEDLVGKAGRELYDSLGALRKAALLNLFKKCRHRGTVGEVFEHFESLLTLRQDRCFVRVRKELREYLATNSLWVAAPNVLHEPLKDYALSDSLKSQDAHANLQITLQVSSTDGSFAADVDIDEASGFGHWGEVLRNHFTQQRTNPYAIHELLLAADPKELTLDPGYDLVLKG
jgi:hypothetical protein